MSDYKSMITGALGTLVDRVKEVANREAVRDIYEQGASKARSYGRIAKLTLEVNTENESLKRVYAEIGKLYFEQARGTAEGYFAPLFDKAEDINASIAAKTAEIDALKADMEYSAYSDVEVEFEEIVDAAAEEACCFEEEPVIEEPVAEDAAEEEKTEE